MLPDLRIEHAAVRMPGGRTSDRTIVPGLQNLVKSPTLQVILAQSKYFENNVTTLQDIA